MVTLINIFFVARHKFWYSTLKRSSVQMFMLVSPFAWLLFQEAPLYHRHWEQDGCFCCSRTCLTFRRSWVHLCFNGVQVARFLGFFVMYCRSLSILLSIALYVFLLLTTSDYLLHWGWCCFDNCFTCFVQVLL